MDERASNATGFGHGRWAFLVGGLVIATGVIAAIAMALGTYHVIVTSPGAIPGDLRLDDEESAVAFPAALGLGLLWGVVVLVLHRFALSRWTLSDANMTAEPRRTHGTFFSLVVGAVVAGVTSTLLSISILHESIDRELAQRLEVKLESERERFGGAVRAAELRLSQATEALTAAQAQENSRRAEAFEELQGRGSGGRTAGVGPAFTALLSLVAADSQRLAEADAQFEATRAELESARSELDNRLLALVATDGVWRSMRTKASVQWEIAVSTSVLITGLLLCLWLLPIWLRSKAIAAGAIATP